MTLAQVLEILDRGEVAPVPARAWSRLAADFRELESHETGLKGELRVGELDGRLVAVEQPDRSVRAVRGFRSRKAAEAFVRARLEAYDRIWDG